jgi:Fe-S-cluster containining protein
MARRRLPLVSPFGPSEVVEASQAAVLQMFAGGRAVARALEVAENTEEWVEELTAEVMKRLPPAAPFACKEGCVFCCHLKVLVTAPEVIRIAEYLRAHRSEAELVALRDRVIALDTKTHGMSTEQRARANVLCPLLVEGSCSVYEARPLACHGGNSYSAEACEQGHLGNNKDVTIPMYQPQLQNSDILRGAISNGAARSGLDGRVVELIAALRIALEKPTASRDWSRGKPAFEGAVDAEFEAAVRRGLGASGGR